MSVASSASSHYLHLRQIQRVYEKTYWIHRHLSNKLNYREIDILVNTLTLLQFISRAHVFIIRIVFWISEQGTIIHTCCTINIHDSDVNSSLTNVFSFLYSSQCLSRVCYEVPKGALQAVYANIIFGVTWRQNTDWCCPPYATKSHSSQRTNLKTIKT